MAKIVSFDSEARAKLKSGIDQLANAVKVTLGPKGRNVVIQKSFGAPIITKDGVTVAKEIELEDSVEKFERDLRLVSLKPTFLIDPIPSLCSALFFFADFVGKNSRE